MSFYIWTTGAIHDLRSKTFRKGPQLPCAKIQSMSRHEISCHCVLQVLFAIARRRTLSMSRRAQLHLIYSCLLRADSLHLLHCMLPQQRPRAIRAIVSRLPDVFALSVATGRAFLRLEEPPEQIFRSRRQTQRTGTGRPLRQARAASTPSDGPSAEACAPSLDMRG